MNHLLATVFEIQPLQLKKSYRRASDDELTAFYNDLALVLPNISVNRSGAELVEYDVTSHTATVPQKINTEQKRVLWKQIQAQLDED